MRINYETERVAKIRKLIKELDNKELQFLQEYVDKERQERQRSVYEEWIEFLEKELPKSLH